MSKLMSCVARFESTSLHDRDKLSTQKMGRNIKIQMFKAIKTSPQNVIADKSDYTKY